MSPVTATPNNPLTLSRSVLKFSYKDGAELAETTLHSELKNRLARSGDALEVPFEGYIIDIVRGDLLIEIQTRSFSSLKDKLGILLTQNRVHLVHPIPQEKWIIRTENNSDRVKRRRSPKRGRILHLFDEMVYLPELISHPNFSLEILLTRELEYWVNSGAGSWRRKGWQITDRRLVSIEASKSFSSPADYLALLPEGLPQSFTTQDLAAQAGIPRRLAQKMAYCLKKNDLIQLEGKKGRANTYQTA